VACVSQDQAAKEGIQMDLMLAAASQGMEKAVPRAVVAPVDPGSMAEILELLEPLGMVALAVAAAL